MRNPLAIFKRKAARDTLQLQVAAYLTGVGNIATSIALAAILGAQMQGIFVVAYSLYATMYFFVNMGLLQAAVARIAAAVGQGDTGKVADWLGFITKAYLILGTALALFGWFVLPWLAELIYDQGKTGIPPRQLGYYAAWFTALPLLELPRVVAVAAFQGTRRMLALAQLDNGMEISRVFLVVVFSVITWSPAGPIIGTLASSVVGSLIAIDRYARERRRPGSWLPWTLTILRDMPRVPLGRGVRLGFKIGVLRGVEALTMRLLPPVIIQAFAASKWAAYFRVAQSIMHMQRLSLQGLSRVAYPALNQIAGQKDMQRFARVFKKATLVGGGIMLSLVVLSLPILPMFVRFLYPDDYGEPVVQLYLILAIGFVSAAFALALDAFYVATNTLSVAIRISLLGAAISIGSMVFFCWLFPERGAAIGTVVSMLWGFVHYAYIFWFFRTGRHLRVHAPTPATVGEGAAT